MQRKIANVTQAVPAAIMTSLQIAELVQSRHEEVKRSIERLSQRGVISLPPTAGVKVQRERRVETVTVYQVGKRDSYVIVAQLSPEFTGALVDRWQELETAVTKPTATTIPPHMERYLANDHKVPVGIGFGCG